MTHKTPRMQVGDSATDLRSQRRIPGGSGTVVQGPDEVSISKYYSGRIFVTVRLYNIGESIKISLSLSRQCKDAEKLVPEQPHAGWKHISQTLDIGAEFDTSIRTTKKFFEDEMNLFAKTMVEFITRKMDSFNDSTSPVYVLWDMAEIIANADSYIKQHRDELLKKNAFGSFDGARQVCDVCLRTFHD